MSDTGCRVIPLHSLFEDGFLFLTVNTITMSRPHAQKAFEQSQSLHAQVLSRPELYASPPRSTPARQAR